MGLFRAPLSAVIEKTGRFWTITMTFSERYNILYGKFFLFGSKIFKRFVTTSENVTAGAKNWPIFRCFFTVVTWFFNFSKIGLVCLNRMQEDVFVPILAQIGQETAEKSWREKKRKKASRQKNIIILKNCILAKTEI